MASALLACTLTIASCALLVFDKGPSCGARSRFLFAALLASFTAACAMTSLLHDPPPALVLTLIGASPAIILIATGLVTVRYLLLARAARRQSRNHVDRLMLVSHQSERHSEVRVLPHSRPFAYSIPGTGHIVMSTGTLSQLDDDTLAAVLAHERAHIRHRDHYWLVLASACSIVSPHLQRRLQEAAHRGADCVAVAYPRDRLLLDRAAAALSPDPASTEARCRGCWHKGDPSDVSTHNWWAAALVVGLVFATVMPIAHVVSWF